MNKDLIDKIEELKEFKEILINSQGIDKEKEMFNENNQELSSENNSPIISKSLSRGTYPGTERFFSKNDNSNGFINFLLMSMITLFFEGIFILISYFMYR